MDELHLLLPPCTPMVGLHREGISDEEMQQEEAFVESTLQWIPAQVSVKQNSVPVLAVRLLLNPLGQDHSQTDNR